jgi:hypothetical protein
VSPTVVQLDATQYASTAPALTAYDKQLLTACQQSLGDDH